jgi:hypothetical protein
MFGFYDEEVAQEARLQNAQQGGGGGGGGAGIVSAVLNIVGGGIGIAQNAQQLRAQKNEAIFSAQSADQQQRLLAQNIVLQNASAAAEERRALANARLEAARGSAAAAGSQVWVQVAVVGVIGVLGYVYLQRMNA